MIAQVKLSIIRKKENVEEVEIVVSENAPLWIQELSEECKTSRQTALQKLSDIFEAAEKRKDARVYREIEFSLPRELTKEQNIEWARVFINDTCVSKGMLAIMNYHFEIDEKTRGRKTSLSCTPLYACINRGWF